MPMHGSYCHKIETKYVVCHNGIDVYQFCVVEPGQQLTTGQPFMDIFDTEAEMLTAYGNKE